MVGVPGRSKGCNTCIRRKIRCDQETPMCGNCRKSNRLCTGYRRRLGYVLSRDVAVADQTELTREENTVTVQGRWRRLQPQNAPHATYKPAEPQQITTGDALYLPLNIQISAIAAIRQQLHYVYMEYNLPAEVLDKGHRESAASRNWLFQLQDVAIQSPALEAALAAFFAANIGRAKNDRDLIQKSRSMYITGLKKFQEDLKDPRVRLLDETLAACTALSLYELTESLPGTQNAYLTHQRGAMMLLHQRGPDASASPLGQSLFIALRTQISAGIGTRLNCGETFLSDPEWSEKAWKLVPKTTFDELIDLLLDFHANFHAYNEASLETDTCMRQAALSKIVANCLNIEAALRDLYANFAKSVSGPLYWPELSSLECCLDDEQRGKVFSVAFKFPAFFVAQVVVTYWAGMMSVHHLLVKLYETLAESDSSMTLASAAGGFLWPHPTTSTSSALQSCKHDHVWKAMTRNICQSAEYFFQDNMGIFGQLFILSPLSGCKRNLEKAAEDYDRETGWIGDLIERIQKKAGFPILKLFGN